MNATSSPFAALLNPLMQAVEPLLQSMPAPPEWLQQELRQRAVLWMNHLLGAEPAARERLLKHQGKVARVEVGRVQMDWLVTPAGMFDVAAPEAARQLSLTVLETSPIALAQLALQGQKPDLRIEGDVQFAAEIAWLMENLRWDYEQDLSKIVGDAPASVLGSGIRKVGETLQSWTQAQGAARAS
jgi:ubiquinone biosynthesis protein UbiJ